MSEEEKDIKELLRDKVSYTVFFSILGITITMLGITLGYFSSVDVKMDAKIDTLNAHTNEQMSEVLRSLGRIEGALGTQINKK